MPWVAEIGGRDYNTQAESAGHPDDSGDDQPAPLARQLSGKIRRPLLSYSLDRNFTQATTGQGPHPLMI